MRKILLSLFALLLVGSMGMVKAQSVTGALNGGGTTHNDQFFTGKAVTVDLSTGGTVRLAATSGYGGEKEYDITGSALTLELSNAAVEPVQVVHPDGTDDTYNVGSHVAVSDLDFDGMEQNMKAYVATAIDGGQGTVTLAESAAIASGDAFVMRAEEKGWYCIPLGGSAIYATNLFKGNATQSTPLENTKTYYALHRSGVFAKINTASVSSVPAGRAFLEIGGTASARSLSLVFDGDPTAIESVSAKAAPTIDAPTYNIAGQRVNTRYRGLVVVNGKKIMNNN